MEDHDVCTPLCLFHFDQTLTLYPRYSEILDFHNVDASNGEQGANNGEQ